MSAITLQPIGWVQGGWLENADDDWGAVEVDIVLDAARFTRGARGAGRLQPRGDRLPLRPGRRHLHLGRGAAPPRNPKWPKVGIFAQRGSPRPNRLGVTTVDVRGVEGLRLRVRGLDAIDGTPLLDVKPAMSGFEPRTALREPAWAREIMDRDC